MLAVSDQFLTIEDTREAIHHYVLDEEESYKFIDQTVPTILSFAKTLYTNSESELLYLKKRRCYHYSYCSFL